MTTQSRKFGILVGGGPAPGINSVIEAVTIRAVLKGIEVVGIRDGFQWIMAGDTTHTLPLSLETTRRLHFRGGSYLGTSRANPTKDPKHLEAALASLTRLGVTGLITIGGDDTAYSAARLEGASNGALQVVHVPKTIDNDLALPHGIVTFGFQTARHLGVDILKNLMVDAHTTSRWYFAITMGRKAGHLALGIGKASGATLTLIPEEFRGKRAKISELALILAGAIVKRRSVGRLDGVAVLAEGLAELLDPAELEQLGEIERDEHGHIRLAELDLGDALKRAVENELKSLGLKTTIVTKEIGYELRCADPIPFDIEYTRDLGYCAAEHLLGGGSAVMVSIDDGRFVPIPFKDILDPKTGRTAVRLVEIESESYKIARDYMVRLGREDFEVRENLIRLAGTVKLEPEVFRRRFEPALAHES